MVAEAGTTRSSHLDLAEVGTTKLEALVNKGFMSKNVQ